MTASRKRSQPAAPTSSRRGALLLAAVVFGGVVIWLVTRGSNDARMQVVGGPEATATPASSPPAESPPPGRTGKIVLDDHGNVVAEQIANPHGEQPFVPKSTPEETARAIEEYRFANRYPPTSQPLRAEDGDLIRPNQRYEKAGPSGFDDSIRLFYSGAKNTIVGNEPIATFLEVTHAGKTHPVKVLAAQARIEAASAEIPLVYSGGGGRYTNQFSPAALGVTRAAVIETEIWFELGPAQEESRTLRFFYTPEAVIPARFTGNFRDAIEDGSLVIYAGIDVIAEGHYVIDCNLYGPGDAPVMWSRHKGPLPKGSSEVKLVFFGKALRDLGVAPPYHIGQLRGGRHVLGQDPDIESMPLADWRYTTQTRFTLEDLSDAEWDSEHKRNMIDLIEKYGTKPGADPR
jgi:hypothetical protein